jgi:hypothetical protein
MQADALVLSKPSHQAQIDLEQPLFSCLGRLHMQLALTMAGRLRRLDTAVLRCCSLTQVLLGDAAHAVFNYIGQGTNLAMEDGLILENILAEETEVGRFVCSVKSFCCVTILGAQEFYFDCIEQGVFSAMKTGLVLENMLAEEIEVGQIE